MIGSSPAACHALFARARMVEANTLAQAPEDIVSTGGSCIISPLGEVLAGPARKGEEILFADIDLDEIVRGKFDFDVAGHYARDPTCSG